MVVGLDGREVLAIGQISVPTSLCRGKNSEAKNTSIVRERIRSYFVIIRKQRREESLGPDRHTIKP